MEDNFNERILSPEAKDDEIKHDVLLRPGNFSEYVGQKKIVDNINVMVQSALMRKHAMDHVLLSGPPGLGKTSLAMLIAKELKSELHLISGPAVERLASAPIKECIVTNTIPLDMSKMPSNIKQISVAPLLAQAISRIHDDESISSLFGFEKEMQV